MTTTLSSGALRVSLQDQLQQLKIQLQQLNLDALARRTGFLRRVPRKIPMLSLVLAVVALAAETSLSLERVAAVIGLAAGLSYTKQALHARLGIKLESFLAEVVTSILNQISLPVQTQGWFRPFQRVLLHDSTVQTLPAHLAAAFPGSANGKRRYAALKVQFVCDLLHSQVLHLSLSGFTRNDQAASADILKLLQAGDLIIRDLGYFVLKVMEQLHLKGAFFLSRFRHGVSVWDLESGKSLDLVKLLRPGQSLDRQVLLGAERVAVRLVAQPVPEALANERRRKALANRDQRCVPSKDKLYLLSWNIFVTNVPSRVWPLRAIQPIYRLRWRIETIFKAWKSHLGLRQLNCRTQDLLRLSAMTKLLFCIAVYRFCDTLELMGDATQHVSLLRLARIIGQCAGWFAATWLGISMAKWLEWHLRHHLFYETRKDRKNFYELLAAKSCLLG
jgi:hypothetical protein